MQSIVFYHIRLPFLPLSIMSSFLYTGATLLFCFTLVFAKLFQPMGIRTASIILSLSTFISYGLGFIRDKTLAYFFGQTGLTDVYNLAFTIPDFIFTFCIAGALTGVFIPIYISHKEESTHKADELASIFLSVMGVFVTLICIIAWIFTPALMRLIPHTSEHIETAITMTRIMLLSPLILGLSNTIGSIHIAHKHFFSYSLSSIMYNLGIIFGIVLLAPWLGIYAAAVGVLVGALMHASIRLFDLKNVPFHYRWTWTFQHPGFQKILLSMIPRSMGLASITFVTFFCGVMGPQLTQGGFTAFTYARNFQSFPISFFGITLATAVLPIISEFIHKKEFTLLSKRMNSSLRQLLFLTIPAGVGISMLAPAIISLLKGGAFTSQDAQLTSTLLIFLSISIPFESLTHLYTRGFNAFENTYFPAFTNVLFSLVAVSIIWTTSSTLGITSFALGWAAGGATQFFVLFLSYHFLYKCSSLEVLSLFTTLLKSFLMCIGLWAALTTVFHYFSPSIFSLLLGIGIGSGVFLGIGFLCKAEEMDALKPILARFIPKKSL